MPVLSRTSDLRVMEVINVNDGRRLGIVSDIEFDLARGTIKAIVVPGEGRFLGVFGRKEDIVIPWNKIRKFGEDVILVDVESPNEPGLLQV